MDEVGGRERRSEATAETRYGLWVGGEAACVEGWGDCGMPGTGMGREPPAGRDKGKLGRLVLIGIPRWYDVGVVNGYGALAKGEAFAGASGDGAWLRCPGGA